MTYRHTCTIVAAAILAMGLSACSDKADDPEALVAPMTDTDLAGGGAAHRLGGSQWGDASAARLLGATASRFSVSLSCQVRFSQGNLQYNAADGRWSFASCQYLCAATNPNAEPGVSDLFGFGTSGWSGGIVAYSPQSTDTADSNYRIAGDSLASLLGDYAEADWAYNNAIANGGNRPHRWRVLTSQEWQYLLGTSGERRGKWGLATIEGAYHGLVILPDGWKLPQGLAFTPGADGWTTNEYNAMQWYVMENAGAVFLPAAGYREGDATYSAGLTGNYWSVSAHGGANACDVFFRSHALDARDHDRRHYGFSVRPVLD